MKKPNWFQRYFKTKYYWDYQTYQVNKRFDEYCSRIKNQYLGKRYVYHETIFTVVDVLIPTQWVYFNSLFVDIIFDKEWDPGRIYISAPFLPLFTPIENRPDLLLKEQFNKDLEDIINE